MLCHSRRQKLLAGSPTLGFSLFPIQEFRVCLYSKAVEILRIFHRFLGAIATKLKSLLELVHGNHLLGSHSVTTEGASGELEDMFYEVVTSESVLRQADLLPGIAVPPIIPAEELKPGEKTTVEISELDAIVLSQSCDLEDNDVELVLVARYDSWHHLLTNTEIKDPNGSRGKIRRGYTPHYTLLKDHPELPD